MIYFSYFCCRFCANATGLHYCLEDPHYPDYDVKLAISQDYLFDKKYSDIADQCFLPSFRV